MNTDKNNTELPQSSVITGALISLSDFLSNNIETGCLVSAMKRLTKYADFLKQPLTLGMFVPCKLVDNIWVRIKEPKEYQEWLEIQKQGGYSLCHNSNEYHKALDRILFKGIEFADVQPSTTYNYYHIKGIKIFEANNQYNFFPTNGFRTIEDLVKYNLKLTNNVLSEYFS